MLQWEKKCREMSQTIQGGKTSGQRKKKKKKEEEGDKRKCSTSPLTSRVVLREPSHSSVWDCVDAERVSPGNSWSCYFYTCVRVTARGLRGLYWSGERCWRTLLSANEGFAEYTDRSGGHDAALHPTPPTTTTTTFDDEDVEEFFRNTYPVALAQCFRTARLCFLL